MQISLLVVPFLTAGLLLACATPQRWKVEEVPREADIASLLGKAGVFATRADLSESELPPIPVRERLRPCCAFGSDLRAKLGFVPVPGYEIPNILGPDDVGPHGYDSGQLRLGDDDGPGISFNEENNGLVYTCRGGFIDTAHVRDYVDWGLFAAGQAARFIIKGEAGEFALPDEGGKRRVMIAAVDPEVIRLVGVRRVAAFAGSYIAWFMSVWHELATWYGYQSVPGFSEQTSSFSIEDAYSNGIGAKLAPVLVDRRLARSERAFRSGVDHWLAGILAYLGAVPREVGEDAALAVDGLWWDSTKRLPDNHLVKRRNIQYAAPVRPWLVPRDRMPDSLRAACGDTPEAVELQVRGALTGTVTIGDLVTMEIVVNDVLASHEPFTRIGRTVTQHDFPVLAEEVRRQILAELGPDADQRE